MSTVCTDELSLLRLRLWMQLCRLSCIVIAENISVPPVDYLALVARWCKGLNRKSAGNETKKGARFSHGLTVWCSEDSSDVARLACRRRFRSCGSFSRSKA